MILLGISKYPLQSANVIAKRVMEMPRLPDYIKGKGNYVYSTTEGSVGLVIYEFDSAKTDEATEQIINAYLKLYDVPGFSYQLIPCVKARNAAKRMLEFGE